MLLSVWTIYQLLLKQSLLLKNCLVYREVNKMGSLKNFYIPNMEFSGVCMILGVNLKVYKSFYDHVM